MKHLISADRIHDGHKWLDEGSVLEVFDNGTIAGISREGRANSRHYAGYLVPGFVNVHCHLELSHLKGLVPQGTGLIPFLQMITSTRHKFSEQEKAVARRSALMELRNNGVVAVGDIANTADTVDLRSLDLLHIHTFVESIGFASSKAEKAFDISKSVLAAFEKTGSVGKLLSQSLTPHAPYSVSEALFKLIDTHRPDSILTIHNQESETENLFYRERSGQILYLLDNLGIDYSAFQPSGRNSLPTYCEWLSPAHRLILVHNTFSNDADIENAMSRFNDHWWCLCPNANLYIEGRIPDIRLFASAGDRICIGTDSLASNNQLSIFAEMLTIQEFAPEICWEKLLCWATLNGARALGMDNLIGSFDNGKKPGINHLSSFDATCRIEPLFL